MVRVALVHDWLIHMRGGEKVLEGFAELYPDATIYTLFADRAKLSAPLQRMKIKTSFLQFLPGIKKFYRWLLPVLPLVIRTLKIEDAQVVLSSSHCVAKGIAKPKGAVHLCYCHTPMRYLWGFEDVYFEKFPAPARWLITRVLGFLRKWDLKSNAEVDAFIANSENVRRRIQKFYNRTAKVIYPPVDPSFFRDLPDEKLAFLGKTDYYLVVSAFVPYKRIDLVIEAFNDLDRDLVVVGAGPLEKHYHRLRRSGKITFAGSLDHASLLAAYASAKALIFPTEEDFGIVPVEAQARGVPVIGLGKGGALESVQSGVFFHEQSAASLKQAVLDFEKKDFDRAQVSAQVRSFEKKRFMEEIDQFVKQSSDKIRSFEHVAR